MPAVPGVLMHSKVAIAIRDVDVPCVFGHGSVRRPIERIALPFLRSLTGGANSHQQLAIGRKLGYRMDPVVGAEYRVIRTYEYAVRTVAEDTLAEAAKKVATGVEYHDWIVLVAAEYIYLVSGINRDTRCLL